MRHVHAIGELGAHQVAHGGAAPVLRDEQIMRHRKRLEARAEFALKILDRGRTGRRLPRHRLHDGEQVLGAMHEFAQQHAHMLFALLALGDVARRAENAHRAAVLEEGAAAHRNPALDAIRLSDHAIFDLVIALVIGIERDADRLLGALAILRMQGVAENLETRRRIFGQAPQTAYALVDMDFAGDEVPVPDAGAAGLERELHALQRIGLLAHRLAARLRRARVSSFRA